MKSSHVFSQVPSASIPRSSFDRSHTLKTTFDAGYLVPIFADEALPGDTFNLRATAFGRLATPVVPIMDNIYLDTFFFAVPMRLIWDNWQKFNGEQINPGDSTDYLIPQFTGTPAGGWPVGSLSDYFGIPTGVEGINTTSIFHRAYSLIWNEWFRDENLQDSVPVPKGDGPDANTLYTLLKRGKRHDYFTSALPFPQKGDAISLPLGTTAPVTATTDAVQMGGSVGGPFYNLATNGSNVMNIPVANATSMYFNPAQTGLETDLSAATSATINQLRQAFQVQKLLERDARGGSRYTEIVRSHFGVVSPDARLQRPEYLGGGHSYVNVSPIAQTSASGTYADTPQGNLAAMGTLTMHNNGFTKSFTEHCLIIGMICARADLTYQQGINKMFTRQTRYDYYWPALSHIGEQAVLNKEIFAQGTAAGTVDDDVFGYQERYAEYRYKPSIITGKFRSTDPTSLDVWHLAQDFATLPTLSPEFIEENPPIDRVIAVTDEPHFLLDMHFKMRCARPMPLYGVPGLIDHF